MGYTPQERALCRIVGTPIGNLSDLTLRAENALKEADILYAEDTRTAKALLNHLGLHKPVYSYHKDNEKEAVQALLKNLENRKKTVLISEAGMPGISDPGFLLIKKLVENNIPHEIVPGVSAGVHAAVASGLCPEGRYLFAGFLPHKGAEKVLETLSSLPYPIIFYESPHRIKETLKLLFKHFPAPIAVCRELTKLHEEVVWLYAPEETKDLTVKGEFCLVVNNSVSSNETDTSQNMADMDKLAKILFQEGMGVKSITEVLKKMGMKRNIAYETAQNAVKN